MSFLDLVLSPADMADIDVVSIVRESLADVSPRSASLALLRFEDYLGLIQKAGVDPSDELCTALLEGLRSVCSRESAKL